MQTKYLEAQMNFQSNRELRTTIFVKKLQNTKMSIVQNSKTVYELTNKADIKSHLKHQQKIL